MKFTIEGGLYNDLLEFLDFRNQMDSEGDDLLSEIMEYANYYNERLWAWFRVAIITNVEWLPGKIVMEYVIK